MAILLRRVAFLSFKVENDPFCTTVLQSRQKDGCIDTCPISEDVTVYHPEGSDLDAELVTAGFPCQATRICFDESMVLQTCFHVLCMFRVVLQLKVSFLRVAQSTSF